jgi:hypothetical protein
MDSPSSVQQYDEIVVLLAATLVGSHIAQGRVNIYPAGSFLADLGLVRHELKIRYLSLLRLRSYAKLMSPRPAFGRGPLSRLDQAVRAACDDLIRLGRVHA